MTGPEELPVRHIKLGPNDRVHMTPLDPGGRVAAPLGPPEIAYLRVSWLGGHDTPLVEMWTKSPQGDCDGPANHTYWRVSQPWIEDEQEWLRLLGTAKTTIFEPIKPAEPKMRGPQESDQGFLADGDRSPSPRDTLIEQARRRHDRECNCDPRYLMSCPRMAQAILDGGRS